LTNWFFNLTTYVFIFYIPIYYRARGASTTQAGAALIPFSITFPIGSLGAGIITTKTGKYKHLLRAILLLMLLGTIASCTNRLSTPLWPAMFELAIVGLATGAMLTVTLLALISAVESSQQAVVTSLSYVFRSTGSVTGLALASAVYQGVLESDLWTKIGDQQNAADLIRNIKDSLDEIDRLPNQLQWAVRSSYMVALRATYMTTAAFAVMAVVSGLLIREFKPHSTLTRDDDDGLTKGEPLGK
jgi:MFS family permease